MSGIEKLKAALGAAIKVVKSVDLALEDGKVNLVEGVKVAMAGFGFWNAVKNIAALKEEYVDLSDEEREELHQYFVEEFDIRNDKVEEIVEQLFEALEQLSSLLPILK